MDHQLLSILFVCACTFLGGLIDAIAGGGGLITLPAYLAIGLPPHLATGTNKCSSTLGTLVAGLRYLKKGKIHLKSAIAASVMSLIGSFLGARLNLFVDEKYLSYVLIAVVPVITVLILFKKDPQPGQFKLKSDLTIIVLAMLCGFGIGVYDGFFGPGTGTFLIFCFTGIIGFDAVTSSGNAKLINFCSNLAAFITFAVHGKIIYSIGLPAAAAGIAGNWLGAGLALRYSAKVIKPMLVVSVLLLLGKIIYDLIL
ncbi:putative membrane transporter protein [Ruminococcaceae bacterium BL-6]|mgnify:FL=1|jgi:hypothetical protein|nr:putative membrane transporter protein [Ruminococcaceae bacterium BL-6]